MDGFIVNDRAINNMLSRYNEKPYFTVIIPLSRNDFKERMKDIFILMNRYYSSFKIVDGDNIERRWEDVILNNSHITFEIDEKIEFNIPIYYEMESEIKRSCIDQNGLAYYFDINHSNEEVLILFFRPNCYTDKNYVEHYSPEKGWIKSIIDQSTAAKINRDNLSNFLTRLEILLGEEIIEYGACSVHKDYTYKYGFKENAVLDDLPEGVI